MAVVTAKGNSTIRSPNVPLFWQRRHKRDWNLISSWFLWWDSGRQSFCREDVETGQCYQTLPKPKSCQLNICEVAQNLWMKRSIVSANSVTYLFSRLPLKLLRELNLKKNENFKTFSSHNFYVYHILLNYHGPWQRFWSTLVMVDHKNGSREFFQGILHAVSSCWCSGVSIPGHGVSMPFPWDVPPNLNKSGRHFKYNINSP